MGSYYMATFVNENKTEGKSYDTHKVDQGLKLMEHSYLQNGYCLTVMAALFNNPQRLVWLCDYHEKDDICPITWDDTTEPDFSEDLSLQYSGNKYYIINHDKKCYIDIIKLMDLYKNEGVSSWMIHPVPILCNSDETSQGGGDFHPNDSRRATWACDHIETSFDKPNNYIDVTEDCLFFER